MTWALVGNELQYSGASDPDITGLIATGEVSVLTVGDHQTVEILNNRNIRIMTGAVMDIDPDKLTFTFTSPTSHWRFIIYGTVNINGAYTLGAKTFYSTGTWIKQTDFNKYLIRVYDPGILNCQGGRFSYAGRIYIYETTSACNFTGCIFDSTRQTANPAEVNIGSIFYGGNNTTVTDCTFFGWQFVLIRRLAAMSGVKVYGAGTAIAGSSGTPADQKDQTITDCGIVPGSNVVDLALRTGIRFTFQNSATGSAYSVGAGTTLWNQGNYGYITFKQFYNLTVALSGTPVQGAAVYIQDADNGNRKFYTDTTYSQNVDLTQTQTYQGVTGADGKLPADFNIVLAHAVKTEAEAAADATGTPVVKDYRDTSNDGSDIFNVIVFSYLGQPKISPTVMKSVGTLEVSEALLADQSITETTKATVDAYATLETPAKLYDYAKAYLVDNHSGETSTLVSLVGAVIDAGSYNVIIDSAAASVFAFDGTTITIKASSFSGGITTTGTITVQGTVALTGDYTTPTLTLADTCTLVGEQTGNLVLTTATNLTGLTVSGTLSWNDASNKEVTLTGCSLNVAQNDGAGVITVILSNTTVTDTSDLEVSVVTPSSISISGTTGTEQYAVFNNSGTLVTNGATTNGTTTYANGSTDTGVWTLVIKKAGEKPLLTTWTASDGSNNTGIYTPTTKLLPDGSTMYTATTDANVTIGFVGNTRMNIDIGDAQVLPQAIFDEVEQALETVNGLTFLAGGIREVSVIFLSAGNFVFMDNDIRVRRASAGDANATIGAFVLSTQGTVIDSVNGSVAFITSTLPSDIVSALDTDSAKLSAILALSA